MEPLEIRPFEQTLEIRLSGTIVTLPRDVHEKMQVYWKKLCDANPHLHNGEVFTVARVHEDELTIHIELDETDYAHYVYSRDVGGLGKHAVRIIHPAALVMAGNTMIFGQMASHTSLAGVIQTCGGGIDLGAVRPDGVVDVEHTIACELREELGIDMHDRKRVLSARPVYWSFGGTKGKMVLVYIAWLNETSEQFLRNYRDFTDTLVAQNEEPEFDHLFGS